ncbi:MAG: NYN domain-containing protein [Planctomycetota bacterium]
MSLIVDCYNVLHETMPPALAGLDEGGLCRALAASGWASAGSVTVVADGRPKPLRAATSPVADVELVFAGSHRSADDLIVQMIDRHTAPRRLTVVSSDRQIRAAARRRRARDLPSDRFIDQLARQLRRRGQGPPPPGRPRVEPLPPELVERWRRAFGIPDDDPPPTRGPPPRPPRNSPGTPPELPRDLPRTRPRDFTRPSLLLVPGECVLFSKSTLKNKEKIHGMYNLKPTFSLA